MELPDIQGGSLHQSYRITRVGVRGLKRPVVIHRPGKDVLLVLVIDVMVNLPAEQRGSHMSRHVEVINRSIDAAIGKDHGSLEDLVRRIALDLLESHGYATYAEVQVKADYFREKISPDQRKVVENYVILSGARTSRGQGSPSLMIGVEASGMSACPCAMETVRTVLADDLRRSGATAEQLEVLNMIPVPTHNQKNRTTLSLEWTSEMKVDADELIDIVERNLSSPTYEILKRAGEASVVLDAHRKPQFVEDIVRDIIDDVLSTHPELPDDVQIKVCSVSEESIHKHDAFAERTSTLGELREGSRHEKETFIH
jgi:GTP cyclohydrolase IV